MSDKHPSNATDQMGMEEMDMEEAVTSLHQHQYFIQYRYKTVDELNQEKEAKVVDGKIAQKFEESLKAPGDELESVKRDIQESLDPLSKIEGLFPVSKISDGKSVILRAALEIVSEKLKAQTAAIFLINKDGVLNRVSLSGVDKNGEKIQPDWYAEESYAIDDKSFVGRTAIPDEQTGQGSFQFTFNLGSENNIDPTSKRKYLEKCGSLRRAIAVPICGRNKTYGVLRVINTIDPKSRKVLEDSGFEKIDVIWLSFLATSISSALSNFRRDLQTKIFQHLSRHLAHPSYPIDNYYEGVLSYYQQALDLLVKNPETAFKAGVLRLVEDKTQTLRVVATSIFSDDVERDDRPRKIGEGLAGFVAENRQRLIFPDLPKLPKGQFNNKLWVTRNNFKTFSCFPLISRGRVVGTLSLYTGYQYDYSANSINFLQSIVDLVATHTFLEFSNAEDKLQKLFAAYEAKQLKRTEYPALEDVEKQIIQSLFDQPSEDISTLLTSLNDEDAQIRGKAASKLGEIGDEQAVPGLCRLLKNDPDSEVRRIAAEALGMLASQGDEEKGSDPEVQRIAAEALGMLASQETEERSHNSITTEALGMLAEALGKLASQGTEEKR